MANNSSVRVFAPASIGNVACGFDLLGLALEQPGDEVVARRADFSGVRIATMTGDGGRLPHDPRSNTASVAADALLREVGETGGIELEIHKNMPMGSGLGSSAASAVAGAVAANYVLGEPLERPDLLPFTLEAERVACGSAHRDNVAASLFGGIVLCLPEASGGIRQLPVPDGLLCTLIRPHIEIKTADARGVLPAEVYLETAVQQMGYLSGFVTALYESDFELLAASLKDVLVERHRSRLIPRFDAVKAAAMEAGALGCSISGAGPSIFALSEGQHTAATVRDAMEKVYADEGIKATSFVSPVNQKGATRR